MRCTERPTAGRWALVLAPGVLLSMVGCSPRSSAPVSEAPPASPVARSLPAPASTPDATPPTIARLPAQPPSAARPGLARPRPPTSHDDLRRQAAQRLVAANPDGTYLGPVPEPLLAIPVLEVELKRDGSVARIVVLRAPRQAKDTSALAMAAVHRAAPFGDVSHLPRPWRFTETFLFDDRRKFKPRTLDE